MTESFRDAMSQKLLGAVEPVSHGVSVHEQPAGYVHDSQKTCRNCALHELNRP